jgi:hypothetical protein
MTVYDRHEFDFPNRAVITCADKFLTETTAEAQ